MPLTASHEFILYYMSMACFTNPFMNMNTCFITKVFTNTRNSLSLDNDSKYKYTECQGHGQSSHGSFKYIVVNSKYRFLALLCGLSFMHVLPFDQGHILALLKSFGIHLCFAFVVIFNTRSV